MDLKDTYNFPKSSKFQTLLKKSGLEKCDLFDRFRKSNEESPFLTNLFLKKLYKHKSSLLSQRDNFQNK